MKKTKKESNIRNTQSNLQVKRQKRINENRGLSFDNNKPIFVQNTRSQIDRDERRYIITAIEIWFTY